MSKLSGMFSPIDLVAFWREMLDEIFGTVFLNPVRLVVTSILLLVPILLQLLKRKSNIPLVNAPSWWQFRAQKQVEWIRRGKEVLSEGRQQFPGKPFKVLTELGEVIVLPPQCADTIKNDTTLNFRQAIAKDFHVHYPGLEPFSFINHESLVLQKVVRKQLTKQLNFVTEPLSSEATYAIDVIFGNPSEWKEILLKDDILDLIARISSRVFLGEELCRHGEWLQITKTYTITCFKAAAKLNMLPSLLHPFVLLFDHDCRQARKAMKDSQRIIGDLIERRRQIKNQARNEGRPPPLFDDAITWAETESNGQAYDPTMFQLTMGFAAIHTTTDLLAQTILCLANQPELIEPLRLEIVEVLKIQGWKKSALYNMKLLDSAVKEAQRIKPLSLMPMRRIAMKDITVVDDFRILKGERTVMDGYNMMNPDLHQNVEKYDIYRWKRIREQESGESKGQLVATSPEQLSFGHGYYSCPGRFFAANEVKLALCHLLMKYDWKLAPDSSLKPIIAGANQNIDPAVRVMLKRRKEEIDLTSLDV